MLPLNEIDKFLPKEGKIIDLGCGQGIIATFLAKNTRRDVIGIDLDDTRLPKVDYKNLKFEKADIRKYNVSGASGIVVSDVLHHINFADQDMLLKNVAKNLKKGGTLVIKEIDTGEVLRSNLSRFWDFVFYPKEKIYFRDAKKLRKILEDLGLKVKVTKAAQFFPGSTNLFICTRG